MSENNLINTCVWCKKSFDNAMELWDHCMGPRSGEVDTEDMKMDIEHIESDASKKRKSSEIEADGEMSAKRLKSIIETNQQFGAGRVEPEKEKNQQQENEYENIEYVDRSAFNGKLYTRQFKPTNKRDIKMTGKQYKLIVESLIRQHIKKFAVSFFMVYQCKMVKYNNDEEEMESTDVYFHSANRRIFNMEQFDTEYDEAMDNINEKFGKYMGEQSGWVLDEIRAVNLNIARYNPIRGASYIKTPKAIEVKKAIVNIQNKDQKCFLYSILASKHHVSYKDHPYRASKYKKY